MDKLTAGPAAFLECLQGVGGQLYKHKDRMCIYCSEVLAADCICY